MELKFRYVAPKGKRIHRYFTSITATGHSLWWCYKQKQFVEYQKLQGAGSTHYRQVRTLKAFRRFLRKNPEMVGKAVLVNKYAGYDIYSKGE